MIRVKAVIDLAQLILLAPLYVLYLGIKAYAEDAPHQIGYAWEVLKRGRL